MTQLMDDLRAPAPTWGHELQAYEREKRRVVDEGFLSGQQLRLTKGSFRAQERVFDPVLQRFRDSGLEGSQRHAEERERISHLNRSQDIHIARGQPFNILNQESRLEALAPGQDPTRLGGQPGHGSSTTRPRGFGKTTHPGTAVDYNIVSNMSFEEHHWQRPGERPTHNEKEGKQRTVPPWSVKDYDILTTRYLTDHENKSKKEKHLNLLEATHKHATQNKFDPVSQQFNDPRREERARAALDGREAEAVMKANNLIPPTVKGRLSSHYDVVSHEAKNPEVLQMIDTAEDERKDRHKNRYIMEHNWHVQDVKNDHITCARKMARVAPERYQEQKRRGYNDHVEGKQVVPGYDIIDGRQYGRGLKEKVVHDDFTQKRPTPYEKAKMGKLPTDGQASEATTRTMASSSSAPQLRANSGAGGRSDGRPLRSQSSGRMAAQTPGGGSGGSATFSGGWGGGNAAHGSGNFQPRGSAPPPAPAIPGGGNGAVFSRPKG